MRLYSATCHLTSSWRVYVIRHLVLREIRQLLVPAVSLAEQRRIVSELDAAERQHQSLVARMRHSQGIVMAITDCVFTSVFDDSWPVG